MSSAPNTELEKAEELRDELLSLYKEYREGKAEILDIIILIEGSKELKRAFTRFVTGTVKSSLENYRIGEHVDSYGNFVPYKQQIDKVIEKFCEVMRVKGLQLLL